MEKGGAKRDEELPKQGKGERRIKEVKQRTGLLWQWWLRANISETWTHVPEPPRLWVLVCVPLLSPTVFEIMIELCPKRMFTPACILI